jgi:hypothetical protein
LVRLSPAVCFELSSPAKYRHELGTDHRPHPRKRRRLLPVIENIITAANTASPARLATLNLAVSTMLVEARK